MIIQFAPFDTMVNDWYWVSVLVELPSIVCAEVVAIVVDPDALFFTTSCVPVIPTALGSVMVGVPDVTSTR
jgi:hypothetical protein